MISRRLWLTLVWFSSSALADPGGHVQENTLLAKHVVVIENGQAMQIECDWCLDDKQ